LSLTALIPIQLISARTKLFTSTSYVGYLQVKMGGIEDKVTDENEVGKMPFGKSEHARFKNGLFISFDKIRCKNS